MVVVALTLLGSLVTSFIGSFACFIIWVHFDFDSRWEDRKERNDLRNVQRGFELEQERRLRQGLQPLPDSARPLAEMMHERHT